MNGKEKTKKNIKSEDYLKICLDVQKNIGNFAPCLE